MWLQFGRTEGSITKQNIAYALMGTYGVFVTYKITILTHEIPNILSGGHVLYEVVIGQNVTYIVCSFPLTIIQV